MTASVPDRLGPHHFAYLRTIAEGISVVDAARRYLAIDHAAEAAGVHRTVVDRVRALARRRGDARWRLVGIEIRDQAADSAQPPPLHEWAAREGLDGWSEAELQEMYAERFGQDDPGRRRRTVRNERLRVRRLQLLRELEAVAAEKAAPTDLLDGWLPQDLAEQLRRSGALTLADLQRRIARGGRWWSGLPGCGPVKARRLARHLEILLGPAAPATWPVAIAQTGLAALSGRNGLNRTAQIVGGIEAQDDREAVRAWIAARAGSPYTATQYEREAERFILWCVVERHKALSDATAADCRAYMDFLANIPDRWISRRKAARFAPGWAPFKGPLTMASQGLAVAALHSLFSWLVQARYLAGNPWVLVNRKLGDDPLQGDDDNPSSRAFTPAAWAAMRAHLKAAPPSASVHRLAWLCTFVECTGLRAAELLRACSGHLQHISTGWVLRVHGKGRRNRTVPVPAAGMAATRGYFASRGIDFDSAPPDVPLLAALSHPRRPITYSSLHETFTRFVRRSLRSLPVAERTRAERASSHWLRHTHATRAAERKVPPDVLQENLGQSDPRTTARYYRAQIARRQGEMERAFDEATARGGADG
jgi:integrase